MPRQPKSFTKTRVTAKDVAREAGVAAGTVGLVMADDPRITAVTKQRVRAAARKMRYRPLSAACNLSKGRTHTIGLIFSRAVGGIGLADTITQFAPVIAKVGDLLTEHDFVMNLSTWWHPEPHEHKEPKPLPRVFRESGIEGALVLRAPVDGSLEKTLHDAMQPFVVMDGSAAPGRHAVLRDERRGIEKAVAHLVSLGHRRIAYDGRPPMQASIYQSPRYSAYPQGYVDAMHAAGLTPFPGWDHPLHESEEDRLAFLNSVFMGDAPATAVIAYDDNLATGVMSWLLAHGKTVPKDVSVVALRDRRDVGQVVDAIDQFPSLTCKSDMHDALATAAVERLLKLIELDQEIDLAVAPEPTFITPDLVVRESTGPPPTR